MAGITGVGKKAAMGGKKKKKGAKMPGGKGGILGGKTAKTKM